MKTARFQEYTVQQTKLFIKYSLKYGYKKYFQIAVILFCIAVVTFLIQYSLLMMDKINLTLAEKAKNVIEDADITIQKSSTADLLILFENDFEWLLADSGVNKVVGTIETPIQFASGDSTGYAKLVAVNPDAIKNAIRLTKTMAETSLSSNEYVIVAERFSDVHGLRIGDEISCEVGNYGYVACISGIAENKGVFYKNDIVAPYEPIAGIMCNAFSMLYNKDNQPYTNLYVDAVSDADAERVADTLSASPTMSKFKVTLTKDKRAFALMDTIINLVIMFIVLMMGILFAVVCYPVYRSLLESRKNDFAVLYDAGAKRGKLLGLMCAESTIYSLFGAVIGVLWAQCVFLLSFSTGNMFASPQLFSLNTLISVLAAELLCNLCCLIFFYLYNNRHLDRRQYRNTGVLQLTGWMAAIVIIVGLMLMYPNAVLYLTLLCLCIFAFLQAGAVLNLLALGVIAKCKPKNKYLRLVADARGRVSSQRTFNRFVLFFIVFATILGYLIVSTDIVIDGYSNLIDSELIAMSVKDSVDPDAIRQVEGISSVTLAAIHTLEMSKSEPIRIWAVDCSGERILDSFIRNEDWQRFCSAPDNAAMVSNLAYSNLKVGKDDSFILEVGNRKIEYTAFINEDLLFSDIVIKLSSGIEPNSMFINTNDGVNLNKTKRNIHLIETQLIVFEPKELMYSAVNESKTLFENIKKIIAPTIIILLIIGLAGSAVLAVVKRKKDYDLLETLGYSKFRILAVVNTETGIYLLANLPLIIGAVFVLKAILDGLLSKIYKISIFNQSLLLDSLYVGAVCCVAAFAVLSFAVFAARSTSNRKKE